MGDQEPPDYVAEPGVDVARRTETYAEVRFTVDDERWRGVPFRLRTGKALRDLTSDPPHLPAVDPRRRS